MIAIVTVVCLLGLATPSSDAAAASGNSRATETSPAAGRAVTERSLLTSVRSEGLGELYALNHLTGHVVRFDLRRGAWQTSLIGSDWADPSALAVSRKGVAWVLDSGKKALVRVAAGGNQRTVATLSHPEGSFLVVDRAGNAYYTDGDRVLKVSRSGEVVTVLGSVTPAEGTPKGLGVDAQGRATVVYVGPTVTLDGVLANVVLATFPAVPAPGDAPKMRTVAAFAYDRDCCITDVREASTGAVTLKEFAGLGSGYTGLDWFAAGATAASGLHGQAAFDVRGLLYVADQRVSCLDPAVGDGSCVPDRAVDTVMVYPAAGGSVHGTIPTSNLHQPTDLAATVRGRVFAVDGSELKTIPPGGGPAYTILHGQFSDLQTAR